VLVSVAAAGVGPWDALIREGGSKVSPQPPLTLGSDLVGVVEALGTDVSEFKVGDEVYGVTNPQFCGAQAEYAVASAGMIALKPPSLNYLEAASAPVIAVTGWQMLFEYAQAGTGDAVMIVGAAGNVGAYAVQMAVNTGMRVVAVGRAGDREMLRKLGAGSVIDSTVRDFEKHLPQVDSILDTVGGATLDRCVNPLKYGGRLVSTVSAQPLPQRKDRQAIFFLRRGNDRTAADPHRALRERRNLSTRRLGIASSRGPSGTRDARGRAAPARQDRTESFLGRRIHSDRQCSRLHQGKVRSRRRGMPQAEVFRTWVLREAIG